MEIKKKKTLTSDLELETDFTMEWDNRGFSVNCEVLSNNDHFGEHLIPSMLLFYVRQLCRECGVSFEQALRSSMGMPQTSYREKIEA